MDYAIGSALVGINSGEAVVSTNYGDLAGLAMVSGMGYFLVIDRNLALFAVLFLLLAILYNPTKFTMGGRVHKDSDIIL